MRKALILFEVPLPFRLRFVTERVGEYLTATIDRFDGAFAVGPVDGKPGIQANFRVGTHVEHRSDGYYHVVQTERRQHALFKP